MAIFTSSAPGSGPTQPLNPDYTLEPLGIGANGSLVTATSGTSNNKGSFVTIGTTASNWCGFYLVAGTTAAGSTRFLVDIRIGGATIILPNYFVRPGNTIIDPVFIPLQIPTGTLVEFAIQCSSATTAMTLALQGVPASSSLPPGFTQATALNVDVTNTRPSTVDVPFASSLPSPLTQLVSSTAAAYGALLGCVDGNATTLGTAQDITAYIGIGASSSETRFGELSTRAGTSTAPILRANVLYQKAVPISSRLSASILAATPGTDNGRIGLYGFA